MPIEAITGEVRAQPINDNFSQLKSLIDQFDGTVTRDSGTIHLNEHPMARRPALTKDDVTDVVAEFVADPFMVYENGEYHMFMEVMEDGSVGHIGHATSQDGIEWQYNKLVIKDGTHCSYPFVFKQNGIYYMIPERGGSSYSGLELWKATSFPEVWELEKNLFSNDSHVDATPFFHESMWYIVDYDGNAEKVNLYYSTDITSTDWTKHPSSPIASGEHVRPAGRPIRHNDFIELPIQEGVNGIYGEKVYTYRILELTPTNIVMKKLNQPLLEARDNGLWNSYSMHHVDLMLTNKSTLPIALVDGRGLDSPWSIHVYTMSGQRPKPYLRVILDTEQAVETETWTQIIFDKVMNDSTDTYDEDNGEYVVEEEGLYNLSLSGAVQFHSDDVARDYFLANLRLKINDVESVTSPQQLVSAPYNLRRAITFSYTIPLKKNDVLTVEYYQASGDTLNVSTSSGNTWFNLIRVD